MSQVDTFDKELQDAQAGANQEDTSQTDGTSIKPDQEAEPGIDYEVKFKESSKEALRLLEENKALKKEVEERKAVVEESQGQTMESLYPGFEQLDAEAQANLIALSEGIAKKNKEEFYKDPAIAFARKNYNESKWDSAFATVTNQYPELLDSKDEFKSKYFNVNNVPENIDAILGDIAKIYLFDKARSIGAEDEKARQERIESERATGGDRDVSSSRTLEDWQRMAQDNPAKFAQMSKEYHADLQSGKLKE